MKRFFILLSILFCTAVFADTININWIVDGQQYGNPTTCEYSGDVILPTPPTKYGYTFAGWEPGNYVFLEYITGVTGQQYINTGINPDKNQNIFYKGQIVTMNRTSSGTSLFGARPGLQYSQEGALCIISNFDGDSTISFDWFTKSGRYVVNTPNIEGDVIEIKVENNTAVFIKNGVIIGTHTYSTNTNQSTNYPYFINGNNNGGTINADGHSTINIEQFIIEGIADMRPAIRISDNAVGMYDVIRGRFFENAGTGAFTAGPVINE